MIEMRIEDGDLLLKNEINERLPVVTDGLVAHYPLDGTDKGIYTYFVAYAQDYLSEVSEGIWNKDETIEIYNYGRSWHISVWDMKTNNWAVGINFYGATGISGAHARFDVYGDHAGQSAAFVSTLTNLSNSYIVVIAGSHAPDYHTTEMDTQIKRCGGSTEKLDWSGRDSYICVGEVDSGEGNAQVEVLNNIDGTTARAEFGLYTKAFTNTNNTMTYDGIGVEEATTNLVTIDGELRPTLSGLSVQRYPTGTFGSIDGGYANEIGAKIVHETGYNNSQTWFNISNQVQLELGNTYTISVNCLCDVGSAAIIDFHDGVGWKSMFHSGSGKWERIFVTLTITALTIFNVRIGVYSQAATAYFKDYQIEEKAFATSFVDGTRGNGYFVIPNPVKTGNYTVNFRCKINTSLGYAVAYQTIMSMGGYYTNNSWTIMDRGGSNVQGQQSLIRKGDAAQWGWAGILTSSSNFNDENMYTVVRDGTNYKTYLNGVYDSSIAHYAADMQDFIYVGSRNGGTSLSASVISDLSIYDRDLSDEEVGKLISTVSSLTSDELIVNSIIEMDGWKHVWGGPFDTWQDLSDDDLIDTDNYGDTGEYDFDEVLILPRFFKRYVQIHHSITTVPETCRLKESWRHYTDALDNEPDVSGTKIKFHSLADGLLDVEANTYEFGMSYGNSWRRYAYVWYGAGTGMYLGNYDSQLGTIKANWGQKYADNYMNRTDMRNDVLIESGRGLTPLKSQTLDVYIRKISTEDFSIRQEDKLIIDKALREGETL